MAARKKKVPSANRSPYGWWLATYVERFEFFDEDRSNLRRRCTAWENTVLIRAKDRETAYRRALKVGRASHGMTGWDVKTGRPGAWKFEGLMELLPIYERLEHGAEIMWTDCSGKSVQRIRKHVRRKSELDVFDDRDRTPARYVTYFTNPALRARTKAYRRKAEAGKKVGAASVTRQAAAPKKVAAKGTARTKPTARKVPTRKPAARKSAKRGGS